MTLLMSQSPPGALNSGGPTECKKRMSLSGRDQRRRFLCFLSTVDVTISRSVQGPRPNLSRRSEPVAGRPLGGGGAGSSLCHRKMCLFGIHGVILKKQQTQEKL